MALLRKYGQVGFVQIKAASRQLGVNSFGEVAALTQNGPELPFLSSEQIEFLKRFVLLDTRMEDIRGVLEGIFDFDFRGRTRTASTRFRVPEPGVVVTREHIRHVVEKRTLGELSEQELIFWATMILFNHAFEPDPDDQEFVSEWLNETSFNGYSGG